MKQLTTRYQERETDCGAAAVAMLCNETYESAAKVVFRDRKPGITPSGLLLNAIRHFGGRPLSTTCKARRDLDLTELEHDALLKCKMLVGLKENTHWAVWDSEGQTIRDPYGYWYPLLVTHLVEIAWDES